MTELHTLNLHIDGCDIRRIPAASLPECIHSAEECAAALRGKLPAGESRTDELTDALAEHGALAAACLYRNGKKAFPDALEALHILTVEELCQIYSSYENLTGMSKAGKTETGTEAGFNESFDSERKDSYGTI